MTSPQSPCYLSFIPAEIHFEIVTYLPDFEDQISASLAYPVWNSIISKDESFRKSRYTYSSLWRHEGLHHLLGPPPIHTFFGITAQSGKIKSYGLYTFGLDQEQYEREVARVLRYRKNHPSRYPPGKRTFEDDDDELGINRRDYTDFCNRISTLDISACELMDEPLVSPYLPPEIHEEWKRPLDFSYNNDQPQWAYLGKMVLQGFPVCLGTSECGLLNENRDFYTFTVSNTQTPDLTLRKLADIIVNQLGVKIPETERGRRITVTEPNRSDGILKPEGIDSEKEHVILIDQHWHSKWNPVSRSQEGEIGVRAIIVPHDDEERRKAIYNIHARRWESRNWSPFPGVDIKLYPTGSRVESIPITSYSGPTENIPNSQPSQSPKLCCFIL
ncbi:hypothetical protein TWF281_008729 [Arthrobotrys megalospora]